MWSESVQSIYGDPFPETVRFGTLLCVTSLMGEKMASRTSDSESSSLSDGYSGSSASESVILGSDSDSDVSIRYSGGIVRGYQFEPAARPVADRADSPDSDGDSPAEDSEQERANNTFW